jgi:hypothetical protein
MRLVAGCDTATAVRKSRALEPWDPQRSLLGATRADRDPCQVAVRYGLEFETLGGGGHSREGMRERHRRLGIAFLRFVKAHRVYPGRDIVAQVWRLEAFRLEGGNDALHLRIDLQQARGVVFALTQTDGKRTVAESVDFL